MESAGSQRSMPNEHSIESSSIKKMEILSKELRVNETKRDNAILKQNEVQSMKVRTKEHNNKEPSIFSVGNS